MLARRSEIEALWREAVTRCDGGALTESAFADLASGRGPVHVLALGKAAGAMASGAVAILGRRAGRVVVAGPAGSDAPAGAEVHEGEHPEPGPGSFAAGRALLEAADDLRRLGEPVLALISGGGSALCEVPAAGLTEADLKLAHRALLRSGAPIEAMNRIRRRLSALKGGGLARALGAALRYEGVLVDVPSADPSAVASGPCRPVGEAGAGGAKVGAGAGATGTGPGARAHAAGEGATGDVDRRVVGDPRLLAETAAALGRDGAFGPVVVREQTVSAEPLPDLVDEILTHLSGPGGLWVATGEVPVVLPPEGPGGPGGRAQHLALGVLEATLARLPPERRWVFLAAGSDGRDGAGAAGAVVDDAVAAAVRAAGGTGGRGADDAVRAGHADAVDASDAARTGGPDALGAAAVRDALARHASGDAHRALGTLLPEHPPRTNLTDLYLAWSEPT